MNTSQRVVRRNRVLSGLLTWLVHLSLLLLAYSVWRENAPDTLTDSWPWKLQLLDVRAGEEGERVSVLRHGLTVVGAAGGDPCRDL
ncbi:hypothetical protein SMICM17S_10029 [Streptomyces microflavus]